MKNIVIGLTGYKKVGKSTAAKHLADTYGFNRTNMKDALVAELRENFPNLLLDIAVVTYGSDAIVKPSFYIDKLFAEKPPLMRALMQNYGTEVRRKDKDSYWVDKWTEACSGNTVVDDVRFLNEAQAVRDKGGVIIRLTRPDVATGGTHASETQQDSIKADYEICVPEGAHEQLYKELDTIVAELTSNTSTPDTGDYDEGIFHNGIINGVHISDMDSNT